MRIRIPWSIRIRWPAWSHLMAASICMSSLLHAQTTERVSVDSAGAQANHFSTSSDMSADGSLIVFMSPASNLVPGDTNDFPDVFLRNRLLGTTSRVSVNDQGQQGNHFSVEPSIATRGRFVAFVS